MGVALEQVEKQYGSRSLVTALVGVGVIAFFASSKLDHKVLIAAMTLSSGLGVALTSLGGSLREISPALQKWSVYTGCALTGGAMGILVRLVVMR